MEDFYILAVDMSIAYLLARFSLLGMFVVGVWMLSRAVRSIINKRRG